MSVSLIYFHQHMLVELLQNKQRPLDMISKGSNHPLRCFQASKLLQMGHKRIKHTLIYTHLIRFADGEFVSAIAKTVDEARKLVEAGFEYVTEFEGIKIFRKRK